jgi:hypothetical protein
MRDLLGTFHTNRKHSKTCSQRCRHALHKLNKSNEIYLSKHPTVLQASTEELARVYDIILEINMMDIQERIMLLYNSFQELPGINKRTLFICPEGKYIEIWNDYDVEIEIEFIFFW